MEWLSDSATNQFELLGLIALSLLLGGIVGFEREKAEKPAGLRTHMLVAGASTTLVGLADVVVKASELMPQSISADPVRIIEAVVTGVTFLGAGTIIRNRTDVEGLTTAASLLFVAALGIAVGLQQFVVAIGGVILALLVLTVVRRVDRLID